jgi:starch phosphorylase
MRRARKASSGVERDLSREQTVLRSSEGMPMQVNGQQNLSKGSQLLQQYRCSAPRFAGAPDALYERHLKFDNIVEPASSDARERYDAAARAVRDILSDRWLRTDETYERENPKRVYYVSIEFLIGRSLANNIMNLMLDPVVGGTFDERGRQWMELLDKEPDAGLGNGGLGRLAACFLDSMATMALPATGYGLRYEHGIFRQSFHNGWQEERPDNWLRHPDPWEVVRPSESVEVKLGCTMELRDGSLRFVPNNPSTLVGVPYDRPVVGYGGKTVNTLRLWGAAAAHSFDFQRFSEGDFVASMAESLGAESLTRVLYPDDTTQQGRGLRLMQEYFLIACSLADIVRRFRQSNTDWRTLADKAAIQLNDTHPALAVPELMRLLLDGAGLDWDTAWDVTKRTLAYTNHTLLPEALERWPADWLHIVAPRQLEIIYEINRRLLIDVRARFPNDHGRWARASLVEEGPTQFVRMANLAIVGSHSTNGVAEIHSNLLRTMTVKDLAETFPERFHNKTNGVTPRRWLQLANPPLAAAISAAIGDGWIVNLAELQKLRPLADDAAFRAEVRKAQRLAKARFADWHQAQTGVVIDPDAIFDCQVKRIHEYKRQLLNALRIVVLYDRLLAKPNDPVTPRVFFFAGKAAPAYRLAKVIIKFINNLAATLDADPAVRGRLKVVFLPEYNVSLAERIIPAADVSNQISTAGYEASGTSNMKFMMNGALTLGTRDGATIEMAQEAGEENFFLFGLTSEQVASSRSWYSPWWHYQNDLDTRKALDLIFSDHFSRDEPGIFEPLRGALLTNGDHFMHLADLQAYLHADQRLTALYRKPDEWTHKVILNIAASGKFSSDRTIQDYASEIWDAKPCPVP